MLLPANVRAWFASWNVPVILATMSIALPSGVSLTWNVDDVVPRLSTVFRNTTPRGLSAKYPDELTTL